MTRTDNWGFTRNTALLILALALLAVAALLLRGGDAELPGTGGRAGETAAAPGATRRANATDRGPAGEQVAERAEVTGAPEEGPPSPGASQPLRGLVIDADQQPIAGADVVLVEELGAGFSMLTESRQAEERACGVTNRDGRFSLPVPFARRLRLAVRAEGFAPEGVEPCYGGEDHTVVLQRGAAFAGRVVDAVTGEPVADVGLEGWGEGSWRSRLIEGRTAADGTFRFDDLSPCTLVFDVTPRDYETLLRQEVVLLQGETARIDIELQRGNAVFGTVTDAVTGLPIAGAEVSAGWTFEKFVRTDAAGNYRMQGAPGPGVSDIHTRATGYARAPKLVKDSGAGEQRMDFALDPAGSVRGRVVDPTGAPQAGIYVAADADLGVEGPFGRSDWQHARSGVDGMFRIQGLVPGAEYTLFLRHRGRATKVFHLPGKIDPDREVDAGDLELEAPAVLVGRVVDQEGGGIADAYVSLRGANDDCDRLLAADARGTRQVPSHAWSRDAQSDAEGRFRFADLAGGSYKLLANVPGGPHGELEGVQVAAGQTTAGVEIAVDLGAVLAGVVVTEDGAPLPQHVSVMIHTAGEDDDMAGWTQVARDGTFRALGLEQGRYRLRVNVSQWVNDDPAPWIGGALDDVVAGREDLRLVLQPAAFISGRVLDAEGRPRQGIVVLAVQAEEGGRTARDSTDDDGRFRVRVLRGAVVDLRYGEAPPSEMPEFPNDPRPETSKLYRGARAGARELVLELP